MSNRSKLEKLNESIKVLNDSVNDSINKISTIQIQCGDLIIKIIESEKLLKDTVWRLSHFSDHLYLELAGSFSNGFTNPLGSLCTDSLHSWLDLEPGIQMRLDEENISLHFDEAKTILPFANKHQLKIDGSNITDRLNKLKKESSALEQIVHQFAIK